MYQLTIIIQCTCIVAVFAECMILFRNLKSLVHSYLFMGFMATLITSVGYLVQLTTDTREGYIAAMRVAWLGRAWISFYLFMFVVELCRIHVSFIIKTILAMTSIATYVIVFNTENTELYFADKKFSMNGQFPAFGFKIGPWHYLWDILLVSYMVTGFVMLISSQKKEKNPIRKKRYQLVLIALFVESLACVINMIKVIPITKFYDVNMLGFPISAVFMLIAIYRYNLLDIETFAKEYAIDELSAGVIAVNDKGNVDFYNKAASRIFPELDTEADNVAGRLKDTVDAAEVITIGEKIYTPERKLITQEGSETGMLYVLNDSTGHFRHIRELEEQKQIANNANKAKSTFLAKMSHEIRTPINAVLGMDEMILRESKEKQTLEYAADIQTSGRTLLSLINDILDFSKIEEGKMEILPTQYELSSVINDLVNMVHERADKKGLGFVVNADPDIPHLLYGDEIRIKQIILNLLTNSIKYTQTGSVTLDIGYSKASDEAIMLSVRVSDTGIGMKEEDLDKLFSPFERIEEQRNRSVEGTGLGMSIVKQLLALMDSRLHVKSEYGKGSSFSFEVRQKVVKWEAMGDFAVRTRQTVGNREGYTELFHAPEANILVVDDMMVNIKVIEHLLKKTQVKIDTALSGNKALSLIKERSYDVIFIDHMMPEMDGIEIIHRMKEEMPDSKTAYVALTANAISGAREEYLREGFSDYLSKPVDGRRLEEVLKRYIPKEKILDS